MSGQEIIYDTSPFNAEAARPALAESEITSADAGGPQNRTAPSHTSKHSQRRWVGMTSRLVDGSC